MVLDKVRSRMWPAKWLQWFPKWSSLESLRIGFCCMGKESCISNPKDIPRSCTPTQPMALPGPPRDLSSGLPSADEVLADVRPQDPLGSHVANVCRPQYGFLPGPICREWKGAPRELSGSFQRPLEPPLGPSVDICGRIGTFRAKRKPCVFPGGSNLRGSLANRPNHDGTYERLESSSAVSRSYRLCPELGPCSPVQTVFLDRVGLGSTYSTSTHVYTSVRQHSSALRTNTKKKHVLDFLIAHRAIDHRPPSTKTNRVPSSTPQYARSRPACSSPSSTHCPPGRTSQTRAAAARALGTLHALASLRRSARTGMDESTRTAAGAGSAAEASGPSAAGGGEAAWWTWIPAGVVVVVVGVSVR